MLTEDSARMDANPLQFENAFEALTGHSPMPWQKRLYEQFILGDFSRPLTLPTGLGKTTVIHIWLLALAAEQSKVPRRLVYVVNRRTIVDQATREAERLRQNLSRIPGLMDRLKALCAVEADPPLAISTLRGQFADNSEWCSDPTRPAIIVGTVDMIGSRLLFSGYRCGFRRRPLQAGFLGQDTLLVHDEAHLEPAFQDLLMAIHAEQKRCKEFRAFHVMELSATSRGQREPFTLTTEEQEPPDEIPDPPVEPIHYVWRRLKAKKAICLHENTNPKKLADEIADLALTKESLESGPAVLVFVRRVEDVLSVVKRLPRDRTTQLTGTLRGRERDLMATDNPIFARFLPEPKVQPKQGTVYLVCTSAGEVGVNISSDHLICDLSTFDCMAQRFGRVNRFGDRTDAEIHVVHSKENDEKNEYESRRKRTLDLLQQLNGDGSSLALGRLDPNARRQAFAPEPVILPTSDILFDAWALTTIRDKLPGRPPVEPYLHGLETDHLETHVAWREEVGIITGDLLERYRPDDLLDDFPLKPHELLRDSTPRVFGCLKALAAPPETPVWLVTETGSIQVASLGELVAAGMDRLNNKTVLLPPAAGGLEKGMLTASAATTGDNDVADEWFNEKGERRRVRLWDDDSPPRYMRWVRTIDTRPDADGEGEDEEPVTRRFWHWYESPRGGDSDGSKSAQEPVKGDDHLGAVTRNATAIVDCLGLADEPRTAVILAARFHDLGKRREIWQRSIGNPNPQDWYAKSGKNWRPRDITTYRHEFGSLLDLSNDTAFSNQPPDVRDLALHLIAAHHGRARPHFTADEGFDYNHVPACCRKVASEVPLRFARLQRKYGRWGLAYLESLLRAADYAASVLSSETAS